MSSTHFGASANQIQGFELQQRKRRAFGTGRWDISPSNDLVVIGDMHVVTMRDVDAGERRLVAAQGPGAGTGKRAFMLQQAAHKESVRSPTMGKATVSHG